MVTIAFLSVFLESHTNAGAVLVLPPVRQMLALATCRWPWDWAAGPAVRVPRHMPFAVAAQATPALQILP